MKRRLAGWTLALALAWSGSATADVTGWVAEVSQSNLLAHVAALEGDRSTPAGQAAAAAYIRAQLEALGYAVSTQPVASSENLWATITGSDLPGEEIVLGAHFDTRPGTPGADDNASGVAAVLEAARILAGEELARTVHLVFFALEEFGIEGSEAFAAAFAAQGRNVVGMISLDMIAYTCTTPGCQILVPDIPGCMESTASSTVGTFIGMGANTASISWRDAFLANAALYQPALAIETFTIEGTGLCFPDSRRSDHKSFWDEGYPALVLSDGAESRNPNYHQPTDTLATLDPAFMTSVTRAVLAHVAASAGPVLPVPAIPGRGAGVVALLLVLAAAAAGLRREARRGSARDRAWR